MRFPPAEEAIDEMDVASCIAPLASSDERAHFACDPPPDTGRRSHGVIGHNNGEEASVGSEAPLAVEAVYAEVACQLAATGDEPSSAGDEVQVGAEELPTTMASPPLRLRSLSAVI